MKVMMTGGKGFIGSWLVPALEAAEHIAETYDAVDGDDIFNMKELIAHLKGIDMVIHLAAYPSYKPDIPPQEYVRLNIIGVARLIEAMKAAKVKNLVYGSSGAIYGFGPNRPLNGWVTPPISESQYPNADQWKLLDIYSASQLAVIAWLPLVTGYGWTVTVVRINCIEPCHLGAAERGDHWGWWCSQAMASSAFIAAVERKTTGFEIVNVGEANDNMDYTMLDKLLDGEL